MNINPIQFMQMLQNSANPQQLVYTLIEQKMGNNPFFSNLITLAKSGRGNEIESIARNMMKERGLDFDKEFYSFKQNFRL